MLRRKRRNQWRSELVRLSAYFLLYSRLTLFDTASTETRRTYRAVFSEPEVVIPVAPQAEAATASTDPAPAPSTTEKNTTPAAQFAGAGTPSQAPPTGNGKKRLREELEEAEASAAGEAPSGGQKSVALSGDAAKQRDLSQGPSAKKKKKKTKSPGQGK